MKKSSIFIFLAIILLIIIVGFIGYNVFNTSNQDNTIKVGKTTFYLPGGFYEGSSDDSGVMNITNGENTIFLSEYNDTNIQKHIEDYEIYIANKNQTMEVNNFTIDNIVIYRTDNIDNPNNVHYWFTKNNNTYEVYKWDNNDNMDSLVIQFIKS